MITITELIIIIALAFFAGPTAVHVFNHMPLQWLCDYDENPRDNIRMAAELEANAKNELYQRIKPNPWRWIFSAGFACLGIRLTLIDLQDGIANDNIGIEQLQQLIATGQLKDLMMSGQLALAVVIACWLMLIIALSDLKYMIIPDQFVIMLAVSVIGFLPAYKYTYENLAEVTQDAASKNSEILSTMNLVWYPLIGMCIGGGVLLIAGLAARLILKKQAMGFGDVKLAAAIGLVTGIDGIIVTLVAGFILSGVASAIGLATKRLNKNDAIPLGTFLCAAAVGYMLIVLPLVVS